MILILNNIIFIIHVAVYLVFRLVTVFPVLFVLALTDTWSNVGNPCQHNPDQQLYYPHPHDADKFIQCTKDGEMYIIQCPAGKEYNPSVTQCAHPVTTTVSISPNPPHSDRQILSKKMPPCRTFHCVSCPTVTKIFQSLFPQLQSLK